MGANVPQWKYNGTKELRSVFRVDLATFQVQKVRKKLKIGAEFSKNVNFERFLT